MRDWEVCLAEYAQRFKERLEIERRELASTRMT